MGFILAWCMPRYIWGPTVKPKVPLGYPYIFFLCFKGNSPAESCHKISNPNAPWLKKAFSSPHQNSTYTCRYIPPPQVERKFVYVGHLCICSLSSSWRLLSFKGIYLVYRAQMTLKKKKNMKPYQADFSLNRKQRSLLFYVICVQYTKFCSLQVWATWTKKIWPYNVYPAGVAFEAVL